MPHSNSPTVSLAAILLALLWLSADLAAQQTGEWLVVDSTHENYENTIPKMIVSSAPGHYVLVAHENSLVGPYVIWRTTDAGTSWTAVHTGSEATWRITGIAHPTPDIIVATAMTRVAVGGGSQFAFNRPSIIRSSDAGVTWQRTDLRDSFSVDGVTMCDANSGAVIAFRWLSTGQTDLTLFATDDGGMTWSEHPYDRPATTASHVYCRAPGSYLVPAYDSEAKQSLALHTSDAGRTWTRTPMRDVVRADFIDSSNAWAVGGVSTGIGETRRDVITRTTDGGATWSTVIDSLIDFPWGLVGVAFADREHGIAVGRYGKILRTTDGGATWIRDWPGSDKVAEYIDLVGVAHAAPNEALALSDYALVLRYAGRLRLAAPWITAPRENTAELPFEVTLEWTPITGAQWYDVQIGDTTHDYNYVDHRIFDEPFVDVRSLTTTSLKVQLAPRTRYVFRVRARNEHDSSDWSVRLSTITRAAGQTLTAPRFTLPNEGAVNVAVPTRLEWTPISGATQYDVLLADNPAIIGSNVLELRDLASTDVTVPLRTNTTYWAIVRARNASETGAWSNFAQRFSFTTAATSGVEDESMHGGSIARGAVRLAVTPNPTDARNARLVATIASSERARLTLVDARGQDVYVIHEGPLIAGSTIFAIELDGIAAGVYHVVADAGGTRTLTRLILVH